jgi:hypothetical protein
MKKRIVMLVVVALVMAAMMLASVLPVFAAPSCEGLQDYNGQHRAHGNADDKFLETGDSKYKELSDKHYDKEVDCYDDVPPGEGQ